MPVSAAIFQVKSGTRRLGRQASVIGIALAGLLLSACAVPVAYGPYYEPVYPETSRYAWVPRDMEGAGPPASLRMRSGSCFMRLRASADAENFTLSWTQEEPGNSCRIEVQGNSLEIVDPDTGRRRVVRSFRRVFTGSGPGLDINQAVDPASITSGFAAVPAAEQRYTLSLTLARRFNGPLPDTARIQLPDMAIGDRVITPPPLQLLRHRNALQQRDDYLPDVGQKVAESTILSDFSGGSSGPVVIWHEEDSLVRFAASFAGTPDSYDGNTRNKDIPEISGRLYVEVPGDSPVRLMDERVAWLVPGDTQQVLVPVGRSSWRLEMYTTADLSERLDHLPDYWQPGKTFRDHLRDFVVVIPGYQPVRFSLTLPQVTASGHEWPVRPVEFEYRTGGVGFGGL